MSVVRVEVASPRKSIWTQSEYQDRKQSVFLHAALRVLLKSTFGIEL